MTLSIITVVYNDSKNLQLTINSIRNQTFRDFEYIIVDGGSTDNTREIIDENGDIVSRFLSEPDNGIYDAMNKGLKLAKGTWVNFLNAGDQYVDSDTLSIVPFSNRKLCITGALNIEREIVPNHQSMFIRRDWHLENLYNVNFKICADYEIKMKLEHQKQITYLETTLICSLDGGVSQSLNWSSYRDNIKDLYSIDLKYPTKNKVKIHLYFFVRYIYSIIACIVKEK